MLWHSANKTVIKNSVQLVFDFHLGKQLIFFKHGKPKAETPGIYIVMRIFYGDNNRGHTTHFYLGKNDLPKANSPEIARGKFI